MKIKKIVWSEKAVEQLSEIEEYLQEHASHLVSEMVVTKILKSTRILEVRPERYPPDKMKTNNDGSYRCYNIFKYKVSYRNLPAEVRILRIRHTKQEPKKF